MLISTSISPNAVRVIFKLNRLLAELNHSHRFFEAVLLFAEIHSISSHKPDHYTFSAAIIACANLRDIIAGTQLQAFSLKAGFKDCLHIGNTLLALYAKSNDLFATNRLFGEIRDPDVYSWTTLVSAWSKLGKINDALQLFNETPHKNVATWNALIAGCVESGYAEIACNLFMELHRSSIRFDNFTLASILSLCSSELLDFGKQVHSLAIRSGFISRVSLLNAMITMYFNSELDRDAFALFSKARVEFCDEITFNAVITGFMNMEREEEAVVMFKEMKRARFIPTELTFTSLMSSCSSSELGYQLHVQSLKMGYKDVTLVSNATLAMYTALGDMISAHMVFATLQERDVATWNTMITCYSQHNNYARALLSFSQMRKVGLEPDEFSVGSLLASSESLTSVKTIHTLITKNGLVLHLQVCNALISALFRHHEVSHAYHVFGNMYSKNLMSSNTMISGLLQNGFLLLGLEHFSYLLTSQIRPNTYTVTLVLTICTSMSSLRTGKEVHGYILSNSYISETTVGNSLITFYAKCGELSSALRVFDTMTGKDLISWNSLISGYAHHGKGEEAVCCFKLLEGEMILPDASTFTAVLSACSRAKLVDDGLRIFTAMVDEHRIEPLDDHISCMISLLGKAGYLSEVEKMVGCKCGVEESRLWRVLLGACGSYEHLKLGRTCSKFLLECKVDDPAVYVQLGNSYAAEEKWVEAAEARNLMTVRGVMKQPGYSLVGI